MNSILSFAALALFYFQIVTIFPKHAVAQLYQPEINALQDMRNNLDDLPGSTFFSSWVFSSDPCTNFSGVVCISINGVNHVSVLSLGTINAGSAGLTGVLSPSVGNLSFLRILTIVPGDLQGSIPDSVGRLSLLEFLGLPENKLSGNIPDSLQNLHSLRDLVLKNNQLSGSVPTGLCILPSLNTLDLSGNGLSGTIPSFSAPLSFLDLQRNFLTGTLPPLPASLISLSLSKNNLNGPLDQLASLQILQFLDLSFNQFSGTIPAAIFNSRLTNLMLQRNQLSGYVLPAEPVSIANIDLSYNYLSGNLSSSLASAQNIYLNNNKFSGSLPQAFVASILDGTLKSLYLQHNYLVTSNIDPATSLPVSSIFCIRYNCMIPPAQSSCPSNAGKQATRPASQCQEEL
ncbi:hypothetical protein O6H91_07G090100 [Diphasiastrum complanatum]|uniref:Uncharacterized protein n=1 Tax=Diphasiastrum complanatum TaxID=34168 RepID=A0ACC2D7K4_DIPCM|nr:hypothetical protein O6H91_Y501800 [Diphasiastrum complanatum]KAJ7550245.1 hypothetical protein O6H91_07G090100 [Diphasiastrum complanatum]